ncbi:MAG: DUF4082 domain-containing protein [Aphanocapsa sp. GSE-SYN-MK-11-07L]|nr:DUF4082 domain-containing protein [Aphanocapsa sp. GSE-SYN-MK-11-07L]
MLVDPSSLSGFQLSSASSSIIPQTVAFIDANIADASQVMAGVQADVKVLLDPSRDGIAQITETLQQFNNLTGINIFSHGSVGQLQLGSSVLSSASLGQYATEVERWKASLSADADIWCYGCNVAEGEVGQAFVQGLSSLTGADIAASTDLTGAGGDWLLEYATGEIETTSPLSDALIEGYQGQLATLFTSQTPSQPNKTDGTGSAGDYELGMQFTSTKAGTLNAIRYYKAAGETGSHVGKIWSSTGTQLAQVTFSNETASGWQQQALSTPIAIAAGTTYIVSVNVNTHYAISPNGFNSPISNGDLRGSNGVFNLAPGLFPTQSWNNSNYFRDVDFTPNPTGTNNVGTVGVSGTPTQNQTLTANVADANGLTGATINYQWQQLSGGTWSNISGATARTLTLQQAQVGRQVRVNATYTDALGTSENIFSPATTAIANVNDAGVVAIAGTPAQNQTLTANVADVDGLTGVTISYQWQSSTNGTTWSNISGATGQNLALDSSYVGQQVRISATYTDVLGGSENILSPASSTITAPVQTQSLFSPTTTPALLNETDGAGSAGDYELGMEFRTSKSGKINAIRYFKSPNETGSHTGRIWSNTGELLASVAFTNETASGWQEQALATSLAINANTTYIVSVNTNSYYVSTSNGLAATVTNGNISAIADGSNGVFNPNPSAFPTQSWQNSNYFRDIVFAANPPAANIPGTVALNGTATENQTLTANVSDGNGTTGVTINYQWQQLNGTTWTDISGATAQTLTLGNAQSSKQVRVRATYTDSDGNNENIFSAATTAVVNVNDVGAIAVRGTTGIGEVLTANVIDGDGFTTVNYQWQQLNGSTWSNISGATGRSLALTNALLGKQLRVSASYTDSFGSSENVTSSTTSPVVTTYETVFSLADMPNFTNITDGVGVSYELGLKFRSVTAGVVQAIRYWKAPSETGTHVGKIWSSTGQLLASVTFTNETSYGWQEQALATPFRIQANTTYTISVNANSYYAFTSNRLTSVVDSGDMTTVSNGGNGGGGGVLGSINALPTQSFQNSNYYRDLVFAADQPSGNDLGVVSTSGSVTENQTLTANVADADGLSGVTFNYQWQQFQDNAWVNIAGATQRTFKLGDDQVGKQIRVRATYVDALGTYENRLSVATAAVTNVNDVGNAVLRGSAVVGQVLKAIVLDSDGLTNVLINYQWQQFVNNAWTNIAGAVGQALTLGASLAGRQIRAFASYTDNNNTFESLFTFGTTIGTQNRIVIENQKQGSTGWKITNQATDSQVAGYADATSVNAGETVGLKVSLGQTGTFKIDTYRLGWYGGAGGRLMDSSGTLNGFTQAGFTVDPTTRMVETNWQTSYNLQVSSDWVSGLYLAKVTLTTGPNAGKQTQIWFVVRNDFQPAAIGFNNAFSTMAAYNNYGGYSLYDFNSNNSQRAYKVSYDRPFAQSNDQSGEGSNNVMTWEYNMIRWQESQGYDVSYFTNTDLTINPLQLHSYNVYESVGHDEYWSMEERNNIEDARDSLTPVNIAIFSANTGYWRVRYEDSSSGQDNRVIVAYKDTSGVGSGVALDPIAQTNPYEATTTFRSPELNRPENALLGVMYTGDIGATGQFYGGFDYVVSNSSDSYFANTGLQNGDSLRGLVGYEWDSVTTGFCCTQCRQGSGIVNNGHTPLNLVVLSGSAVTPVGGLPVLPPGTDTNISNSIRYTAGSGAEVFNTGSIQWMWGLDSYGLDDPRTDIRAQQIATNVLTRMGARPQTPSSGIVLA